MPYLGPGIDNGFRSRFIYTATAGQTSFSGGDSQGITLTYTDSEYLDVYQNGVLLVPGDDYAATTGTTVVLVQGASLNDKVEMIQYQAFGVADTVSRADGGAFGGNISTSGTLAVTGVPTFTGRSVHSGGITIANAGQIGSVGDADAMAISSGGVVTFSQAPVGAGSMIKLYDQSVTGVANVTVDSTIINSTYDNYYIIFDQVGATDGQYLAMRLAVGGSVQTGSSYYGYETQRVGGSYGGANQNTSNFFAFFSSASLGNATGEGVQAWAIIQNVNSTVRPCSITGLSTFYHTDAAPNHSTFGGSVTIANRTSVVNGIQFLMDSGNIAQANFKIYGIK